MIQNFTEPSGTDIYYAFNFPHLNIIVSNNQYFMCEFSGNISGATDNGMWSSVFYKEKLS